MEETNKYFKMIKRTRNKVYVCRKCNEKYPASNYKCEHDWILKDK